MKFLIRFLIESKEIGMNNIEQVFQTYVYGGSGVYEYFSRNNTVFTVDNNGFIISKNMGKAVYMIYINFTLKFFLYQ